MEVNMGKEQNSCRRKIRHSNFQKAETHAISIGLYSHFPYYCIFCGGWHVGRESEKRKREFREIIEKLKES